MRRPPERNSMERPIFIGGEGRSGTTLLAMILDSHAELSVGPELHFRAPANLGPYVLECIDLFDRCRDPEAWFGLREDRELYQGVHFVNRCRRSGITPGTLRRLILETLAERSSDLESFADRCALIAKIGRTMCENTGKHRWGMKIMRDIRLVDSYAAVWPEARFLHIIRDGRDVAASQMCEHATWGYESAEQAARQWVDLIRRTRECGSRRPDSQILELRYEDLVTGTRSLLMRVMNFLDEPWDDALLSHQEQRHALFTEPANHPSIASVRRPIEASAIGRFRRDLQPDEIERYERVAGCLLRELGYASGSGPAERHGLTPHAAAETSG